jgi:SAM-dependent methyltransferase
VASGPARQLERTALGSGEDALTGRPEQATPPLYGPDQSRFARYLERREARRPDLVAHELRRRLLAGLRGRVLELGCGEGRAFEHYPPAVTGVVAVEPDPTARAAARERARAAPVEIEVVDGDASTLPARDASFDAAVVVWVLCTVPEPEAALREVRRVLVPGGELRFYEHVRSQHVAFHAVQRAVDPEHAGDDRGGGLRGRRARPRLPVLLAPDDRLRALRPRRRAAVSRPARRRAPRAGPARP